MKPIITRSRSGQRLAYAAGLLLICSTSLLGVRTAYADTPAKLIKQVAPEYPDSAARIGAEGFVELEFTVDVSGKVHNVSVTKAEPAKTFEVAAVKAVQQWVFQPATHDDQKIETHERRRLVFKP